MTAIHGETTHSLFVHVTWLNGFKTGYLAMLLLEWQLVPFKNPLQNCSGNDCGCDVNVNADMCVLTSIERGTWIIVDQILFFCLDTGGNQCNVLYICMLCSDCSTKEIICGSTLGMARCIWIIHSKQRGFPLILRLWSAASINMLRNDGVRRDRQI